MPRITRTFTKDSEIVPPFARSSTRVLSARIPDTSYATLERAAGRRRQTIGEFARQVVLAAAATPTEDAAAKLQAVAEELGLDADALPNDLREALDDLIKAVEPPTNAPDGAANEMADADPETQLTAQQRAICVEAGVSPAAFLRELGNGKARELEQIKRLPPTVLAALKAKGETPASYLFRRESLVRRGAAPKSAPRPAPTMTEELLRLSASTLATLKAKGETPDAYVLRRRSLVKKRGGR